MKGVILAAGKGKRLYPLTKAVPKPLLPVYDKPMIFYPLSLLKMLGIKDIMIVVSYDDKDLFEKLLGDGGKLGLNIKYGVQPIANGSGGAFRIAKNFVRGDDVALVFGDNILLGNGVYDIMQRGIQNLKDGYSTVLTKRVDNPQNYGIVTLDGDDFVAEVEEKPTQPKGNLASLGIYFYTKDVVDKMYRPDKSSRGEYEITDINKLYIQEKRLKAIDINNSIWFDAGDIDNLLHASNLVKNIYNKK